MSLTEQDMQLIEQYVMDTLSTADRQLVEKKIKASPDFVAELEIRLAMVNALREKEQEILRTELKALYEASQTKRPLARPWYWAAAVVLIAMVYVFLFRSSNNNHALFAAYYQPFPEPPALRGDDKSNFTAAMHAYSLGDYTEALEQLKSSESISDSTHLYVGNCLLNLGHPEKAKDSFKAILQPAGKPLEEHARWYLALSHLRSGEEETAINLLDQIIQRNELYKQPAQELKAALLH